MKRIIVIGLIGLFIWLVYQFPHAMLNPGDLSSSHKELNEKCTDCHKPFWGIDSKKCTSCHKLSEIGRDTTASDTVFNKLSFHQNFGETSCTNCHSEHKGPMPTRAINFSHEILTAEQRTNCKSCHQQPSDGLHKQVSDACNNCHNPGSWKKEVIFNHDMITGFDKANCLSCHKVPVDGFHSEAMSECLSCHNTTQWKPSTFNHEKYFRFDGHHPQTCTNCHSSKNYRSYTCYNCHEHSEAKISDEHYEHGISNFSNCVSCHRSGNKHDAEHGSEGEGGDEHGGGDD